MSVPAPTTDGHSVSNDESGHMMGLTADSPATKITLLDESGKCVLDVNGRDISAEGFTIGASTELDWTISGEGVEDLHARMLYKDGMFAVADAGSTHGTFICVGKGTTFHRPYIMNVKFGSYTYFKVGNTNIRIKVVNKPRRSEAPDARDSSNKDNTCFLFKIISGHHEDVDKRFKARLQSTSAVVIGRSRSCRVILADPSVSREHAKVFRDGDKVFLNQCEGCSGKTLLRLSPRLSSSAPHPIRHGDIIRFGKSFYTVQLSQ
eukprot:TRINITY_DN8784_c0_g1_i1.p1 TRINITY_DN8784_c0_g1~~TRINITY_DN8784_c0_g1_i1.p1  ORF type:complete len:263 (+),score=54.74 TRINITY_DN8784_c0_g1_i1:104-892(+)